MGGEGSGRKPDMTKRVIEQHRLHNAPIAAIGGDDMFLPDYSGVAAHKKTKDAFDGLYVNITGDTMTGNLELDTSKVITFFDTAGTNGYEIYRRDTAVTLGVVNYAANAFRISAPQGAMGLNTDTSGGTIAINDLSYDTDFAIYADNGGVNFYSDAGNNRIGIGTSAPTSALEVVGQANAAIIRSTTYRNGVTTQGTFDLSSANGTEASPTATTITNILGNYNYRGYRSGFKTGAQIIASATQDWSAGNQGTKMQLKTIATNTATIYTFLESDGNNTVLYDQNEVAIINIDMLNSGLSFFGNSPIAQPTTGSAAATFVANTSLIANDSATFDGYTIGQVVKALRNYGLLA